MNADLIYLDIDGVAVNTRRDVAEAFSNHFRPLYNSSCSGSFSPVNQCTEM
jgi:hypothetical protein